MSSRQRKNGEKELARVVLYDVTLTLCNLYKFFYFLRRRWACFSKESAKDNSLLLCIAVQLCIAILP